MKPVLLLDIDGVVADFITFYKLCALRAGIDASRLEAPITQWDVGDSLGLTHEEKELVHERLYRPDAQRDLFPYPEALESVLQLQELADTWFVTAPLKESSTWCYDRAAWISRYFASEQLIFAHHKHLIRGDLFVDDKPSHVRSWVSWNDAPAVLWLQPYNETVGFPAAPEYSHFNSWEVLLTLIKQEGNGHG